VLDQSLEYARLAIEEGEKSGLPTILCRSLILILPVYLALDDWRRSEQHIAQLTDLSAAHALKAYHAMATGFRGRWLLLQNNIRDGIPLLKRASAELEAERHEMLNMDFVADLGASLAVSGKHEEALTLVVNALDVQKRGGKLLNVPTLMRVKGFILASRSAGDYPEAERSLLSSIDLAKRQSATLFELKAATDLAELLQKQGRVPEAYTHLSEALDRMPGRIVSPDHTRALQILRQLQSGVEAVA
jgi:tetratricopeptide (TPR) repeat protein